MTAGQTAGGALETQAPRFARCILLLAVGFSFCFGLGWAPLFDRDEGAFCEATREMIVSGNYLMTYLNGEPRYDKPILIYWLQAASVHAFGLNEFALRLPSALAASVWAWLVWRFASRRLGAGTAFYATLFLATAMQVTLIAKAAIADALLNACIAGTMFAIWRHYETRALRHLLAAYAIMALGVLTKGPIALYVPFATTLVFCWRQKQLGYWWRSAFHPRGVALFLLIALPWPVAAYLDQGNALLDAWFMKQTVKRLAGPLEHHGGGPWYYIPIVILGLLPWTPLFLGSLRQIRRQWHDPFKQFLWIWFWAVFILFSLSGTKLPHYVIYGYTPLCILMAISIRDWRDDRWFFLSAFALLATFCVVPLVAAQIAARTGDDFTARSINEMLPTMGLAYYLPILGAVAAVLALALMPRGMRAYRLAAMGLLCASLFNLHIVPFVSNVTQDPVRDAALFAKANNYEVTKWKLNMPSFMFYSERFTKEADFVPKLGDIVITKITELDQVYDQYDTLFYRYGIILARVKHIKGT